MKISVIIPTYNRKEILARTLETVFSQDFPAEDYEIVVAVDGSTDGTVEYLRGLRSRRALRVIEHKRNRGQAAARNSALQAARGDLVLMIDDDDLCDPNLLREHVAAHNGSPSLVVEGPVLVADDSPDGLITERKRARSPHLNSLGERVEMIWPETPGPNTSAPREMLIQCGGFDERMFRMREDIEFGLRLWKSGARFIYEPKALARTVYAESVDHLMEDAALGAQNEILLCRKHPAYRPHAALAGLAGGSWRIRWLRTAAIRAPISPLPLFKLAFRLCDRMRRVPVLRRAGLGLLELAMAATAYRSAADAMGSYAELRREFGLKLPILRYGSVSSDRAAADVTPDQFKREIGWLARQGYKGIQAADWLAWVREGRALADKPVLITFDGAYTDTAEIALPILAQHGFAATVCVLTGRIGENIADRNADGGSRRLMDAEGIRYWSERGIEFASLGRNHPDLTTLSAAELQQEVAGSRRELQALLGKNVVSFAYPGGRHNPRVQQEVRREFALALTSEEGVNWLRSDLHLLKRTPVSARESLAEFKWQVGFGCNPIAKMKCRVSRFPLARSSAGEAEVRSPAIF